MILSAFADEISPDLDVQLDVLQRHGIRHVDVRRAFGCNVIELDDAQAGELCDTLHQRGIAVATVASPIGKEPADADREDLLRRMTRAATIARLLDAPVVRVFAFSPPAEGDWREASLQSLGLLASLARDEKVTLVLENELGTRADTVERMLDLLHALADCGVQAAFDPANLLRCGGACAYPDAYVRLRPWLRQVHVKDLDDDGRVVPAGCGRSDWPGLLGALWRDGYRGLLSLEPHLMRAEKGGGFTGPALFGEANRALRRLIDSATPPRTRAGEEGVPMRTPLSAARYRCPSDEEWQRRGWRSTGWPFLACVNGKIMAPADAYVPAADEGFLRGDGAFEVLQIYAGHPFALESHLRRFAESCAGILLEFPRAEILADLSTMLDEAGVVDALWRVLITRGGTRLHFLEWVPPEKRRSVPLTLHSVSYQPTIVLSGLKPMSYGANMAATARARRDGADDAIFVQPDGTVLEAPTATVFWASNGVLNTPPLDTGILPSITRAIVMNALETFEVRASLNDVLAADEVFLASTSREIQPVGQFDARAYRDAPGPLCRAARRALDAAIVREMETP